MQKKRKDRINSIINEKLNYILDNFDEHNADKTWLNIFEYLDKCEDSDFFGDLVFPIRGPSIKSFRMDNITNKVLKKKNMQFY